MCVYRSLKNISVQVIDDVSGHTLAAASSLDKDIKDKVAYGGNKAAAKLVGESIAQKSLSKGIGEVAFDRGGFLYHGRVKELADGARNAGLRF
jgi:large subunit ribosomal protein L18